ncbi:hypothetical protein D3C76_1734550 [compost metagenome]
MQLIEQCRDRAAVELVIGHVGWHAHLFEEGTGGGDGPVDTAVFAALTQTPDAVGVLQQFFAFLRFFLVQQRRQDDGQRLGMIQTVHGG